MTSHPTHIHTQYPVQASQQSHFTADNAEAPSGAGTHLSLRKSKLHAGLSDSEIQTLNHHTNGRKAKDGVVSL